MKLAQAAENERGPELDIPDKITRREALIRKNGRRFAKSSGATTRSPRTRVPAFLKMRVEPSAQVSLGDEES
jgi:hypothetical protein